MTNEVLESDLLSNRKSFRNTKLVTRCIHSILHFLAWFEMDRYFSR